MSNDAILAEAVFWARLAGVTGASMVASSDVQLRRQWVDDLIPESCKPSNEGLRVEGLAHLMGHKNGLFGTYRFTALLRWQLVRHPDHQPVVEEIELDHSHKELRLVFAVAPKAP